MRALLDRLVSALARLLLRVFFREIEVVGAERVPRGSPLLLVANHVNSVVDSLLLLGLADARARMLAKSTLFRHPVMGPLLWLAGALPVYRRQDAGTEMARNFETFARCHEVLASGGTVALFPEGTSHNQPHALPLKTGAARIALEALHRHGPLGVRVVPIGLIYEAKGRFRSRVLLRVGEPLDPAPQAALYAASGRAAVRALTDRIAASLRTVTVNYASWEEARLVGQVAALLGGGRALSDRFELWRRVVAGYRELKAREPERVGAAVAAIERYEERLRGLLIEDAEVAGGAQSAPLRRRADSLLGPVGSALNALPYRVTALITQTLTRTPDEPATYALLAGLIFFPLAWALTALVVWLAAGPAAGLAALLLAPAAGPAALRYHEARGAFAQKPRTPPTAADLRELRAERERLAREAEALAQEYLRLVAAGEPGAGG